MGTWKIVIWAVVVIAASVFLYLVRDILVPFALALLISVLLDPTIRKLRVRGYSRFWAVLMVFVVFFGSLGALAIFAVPRVSGQLANFTANTRHFIEQLATEGQSGSIFERWNPAIQARPPRSGNQIDQAFSQFNSQLRWLGLPTTRKGFFDQYIAPRQKELAGLLQKSFANFLGVLSGLASQTLLVLVFTPLLVFIILLDLENLKLRFASWIPPKIRRETLELFGDVFQVFTRYLRGITISVGLYTLVMALLLSTLGAPYAIVLSIIFGAMSLIPYFGPAINAIILLITASFSGHDGNWFMSLGSPLAFGLALVAIYLPIHLAWDNLVTPQIVGSSTGLNPLASMFVVLSGGALFGVVGMLIAFPLAGAAKVVLDRVIKLTTSPSYEVLRLPAVPLRHRSASEV